MKGNPLPFVLLAVVLLGADGKAKKSRALPSSILEPGTRVSITVPVRLASAIAFPDEEHCRTFLQKVKDEDVGAIGRLYADKHLLAKRPGTKVEVIVLRDDPSAPLHVPLARVKVLDAPTSSPLFWIPLQHLRPPAEPLPEGEDRLPILFDDKMTNYVPKNGDEVLLYNYDPGGIAAAAEYADLARYVQARDKKAAMQRGAVSLLADWSKASVLDVAKRLEKKSVGALRVRPAEGPLEGKEVWVVADHCHPKDTESDEFSISIRTYESIMRKKR